MKTNPLPNWATSVISEILDETGKVVIGKREILRDLLVALLAGGHVLLEGAPGVAKTHIARAFSRVIGCKFTRVQFTSDLLPADVTGSYVFDQRKTEFRLRKGPLFSNIVLIDEINRGTPRTQAATIEAMNERQITIEGQTIPLESPYMVIATMNPLEVDGIYPLVQAQRDRFMFRLYLGYPDADEEHQLVTKIDAIEHHNLHQVTTAERINEISTYVGKVHTSEEVVQYMVDLIRRTRGQSQIRLGASPRALIHLSKACKARALLEGRSYVIPDDVKNLVWASLNHRIWLTRDSDLEGVKAEDIVARVVDETAIPGLREVNLAK